MKHTKLYAVLLLAAVLCACGDSAEQGKTDTSITETNAITDAVTEAEDLLDARKQISDDLPAADYNGYVFRMATCDNQSEEQLIEKTTGDVVDDAVFTRNETIKERFNCDFAFVFDGSYTDLGTYISKTVSAGDDAFDLAFGLVVEIAKYALNDMYLNWYELPNVNFEKPWWSESTVRDLTLKGQCYVAVGDFDTSAINMTYCTFYNKNLGAQYDFPDMYDVVNSGKYTISYLLSITKDIYQDVNGNGEQDNDDAYGYCSDSMSNMNAYLWAFDNPIYRKNGDEMEFTFRNEKLSAITETLCSVFHNYDGVRQGGAGVWQYGLNQFAASKTIFANSMIGMAVSTLRELEDDYAILPYPKWDESQKEYYSMVDGGHTAQVVPVTISDPATVSTIIEALNAESYKNVTPAIYDNALKVKGTRDAESVEMLDMIVNSRYFDFGYIYDGWKGASFIMQNLVQKNDPNIESYWAKNEKKIMKWYDAVLEYFEEHE